MEGQRRDGTTSVWRGIRSMWRDRGEMGLEAFGGTEERWRLDISL